MSEILISLTWNPKQSSAFLLMFSDVTFHIETFSTNMTFTTLFISLFIWKRHLRQCNVKSVENISRRNENNGTPTNKAPYFFWFLCGDFDISDIFYKIQILNKYPVFPIIITELILSLIPEPLVYSKLITKNIWKIAWLVNLQKPKVGVLRRGWVCKRDKLPWEWSFYQQGCTV